MEPLDPQLRQLIDDGLPAAMPDAETQKRGLAALLAHIDGSPPPAPAAAPPAAATAGFTKLVIGVAAAGVVATAGWVATRPEPEPTAVRATAPPQAEPPPIVETPAPDPAPTPAPVVAAEPVAAEPPTSPQPRKRRATPKPAVSSPADLLRAEADLIARAESALDRGKPREALALCDMHRSNFETPQLTTERNAIAASAACLVDSSDTKAALSFVRAHPRSALAKKVRQRCGLESAQGKTSTP